MFQGGGVPRWGNIFVLACGNFFVSLSLRWGFDDDDDDRGGLEFYAGQLALESAIGGVGAPCGTAKGGTGPDDARDRHRRRSPGTDNTHGLRAVARQRTPRKKKGVRILRSRAAAWRLTGLSLFVTVLGVRSVVAEGRPRTYTFGANHGRGRGRDGDGTIFSHVPWPGLGGW